MLGTVKELELRNYELEQDLELVKEENRRLEKALAEALALLGEPA